MAREIIQEKSCSCANWDFRFISYRFPNSENSILDESISLAAQNWWNSPPPQKHRTKKEQHFRNIWLLNSWVIGYQLWMTWQTSGGRWKSFEWSEELNNFAQRKTHQIQIPNNDRLYNWTPIQKQFLNTWSLDTLNSNTFHCVVSSWVALKNISPLFFKEFQKSLGFIKFCKAFLSDIIPIKNSFKWGCSRIFAGFKRIVQALCWF